jgi:hypothetical protein
VRAARFIALARGVVNAIPTDSQEEDKQRLHHVDVSRIGVVEDRPDYGINETALDAVLLSRVSTVVLSRLWGRPASHVGIKAKINRSEIETFRDTNIKLSTFN